MNDWIIESLGWTLIHSFWQIGLIALALFPVLRTLQNASAHLRYLVSISALCLALILPAASFVYLSNDSKTASSVKPQTVSPAKSEPMVQNSESGFIPQNSQVPSMVNLTNKTESSLSLNFSVLPVLVTFWLIGILFFSIRLAGGIWTIYTYKTRNISPVDKDWQDIFDGICRNLQIKQTIKFWQSKTVEIPVAIGWLKPVILIPASAFLQIPPKELEMILMHELVHLVRRDYLVNLIQSLVEILFFYHPGIWWISAQIRQEREFAVDEFVSQIFDGERFIYANALANLEEVRLKSDQLTPALAMAGNGGNLKKRVEKILQENKKINSRNISIWSAIFAITFVIGISAGFYWLKTSEFKKSKSGRKVAVVFFDPLNQMQLNQSSQKLLDLQRKYQIPATWTLMAELIKELNKNGKAKEFFSQAHENGSDFMINVPNLSATVFIDGDDQYIAEWKKRVQSMEEYLAASGEKLKYYSYQYHMPKEMVNFLVKRGLISAQPSIWDSDFRFSLYYEKDCVRTENGLSCQPTSAEKQAEIRQKYLQYTTEMLELNQKFALEKTGKEMPQILSMNVGNLSDDSADEIFQKLKDDGYEFVPLEEVLSDEITKFQIESTKDREFSLKKAKIAQKYRANNLIIFKEELENSKRDFKVEITMKNFKPEGK